MSLPPLYALRAFEVAARLNSFSKAAETLNITPGAVSRHVRTLELWFDCELFKRQGPRVEVTEAGRVLAGQLIAPFFSAMGVLVTQRKANCYFMNGLSRFVLHRLSNRPGSGFRNAI